MIRKWKTLGSKIAFEDPWLKIRSDTYETGKGNIIEPYHIIEYPTWINILPITTDLEVLVLKHYRPGADEILTEIPGGIAETTDVSTEETARRELKEETGFGNGIFFPVGTYYANPANQNNKTYSFLAVDLEKIEQSHLDDTEDLELHKVPLSDFLNTIHANRNASIVQALHMTNLFFSLTFILKSEKEKLRDIKKIVKEYYSI